MRNELPHLQVKIQQQEEYQTSGNNYVGYVSILQLRPCESEAVYVHPKQIDILIDMLQDIKKQTGVS